MKEGNTLASSKYRNLKVALLAGGKSGERDISLASGKSAKEALEEAGYTVSMIDPANSSDLHALIDGDFDVAFLCLHGKYGEDGVCQGFLETIGLPYTGSGVLASAVAMDKAKAKLFYRQENLNTPQGFAFDSNDCIDENTIFEALGHSCVVKPATEGSALGVFIVDTLEDLKEAIESVFKIDSKIIIEQYIQGTEITVTIIGGKEPRALPVIQIIPKSEFYDFDSKYLPGGSQHLCPAPLDEDITKEVQRMAIEAHKALDCWGMSRTDMIIDQQGKPWILETNTIPGMTSTSLMPDAAKAVGISFPELCSLLIEYAFEREED